MSSGLKKIIGLFRSISDPNGSNQYSELVAPICDENGIVYSKMTAVDDSGEILKIGGNTIRETIIVGDAVGINTAGFNYQWIPNENGWSRLSGNHHQDVLSMALRISDNNSSTFRNNNCRGLHLIINVSSAFSSPSITVTVEGRNGYSSGDYYPIISSAPITTAGVTVLKVYPGLATIPNGASSDILPTSWRVSVAHSNSDPITYGIDANLVV